MRKISADDVLLFELNGMNEQVSDILKGDCVFVRSVIKHPLDDIFREAIEAINPDGNKNRHLIVLLETEGGMLEIVERMVAVMRKHYQKISFVVPSHAYSAGTVLALSGDEIYMDYYSVLGPIDPQYGGQPGVGYLTKFNELKKSAETKAELLYLIHNFEPAILFKIEQYIEYGVSLISDWLPKYKFKHWKRTETNENQVTAGMRKERAAEIAKTLGDAKRWHTHGRGIHMQVLRSDEIKLIISDFSDNKKLNQAVRIYRNVGVDYADKTGRSNFVHTINFFRGE